MRINKIKPTSPDKVHSKLVKYRMGDCLSIRYPDRYLAVLVSEKFNKYYDFTLLEFDKKTKPLLRDFINGRFFGTRFGSWEDLTFAVDKRMIECQYVDDNVDIELVGQIQLIPDVKRASYSYIENTDQLLQYYLEEIPIRTEKTLNAEKFPDIAFVSKHLVKMKNIV